MRAQSLKALFGQELGYSPGGWGGRLKTLWHACFLGWQAEWMIQIGMPSEPWNLGFAQVRVGGSENWSLRTYRVVQRFI